MIGAAIRTYPVKFAYLITFLSWVAAFVLSLVLHGWATTDAVPALCAVWTCIGACVLLFWGFGGLIDFESETWFSGEKIVRNLKHRRVIAYTRDGIIIITEEGGGSYSRNLGTFRPEDVDEAMTVMANAKANLKASKGEHRSARQVARILNR